MAWLRAILLNPFARIMVSGAGFFGLMLLALFVIEGKWDVAAAATTTIIMVVLFYIADRRTDSR